jgi:hypothetical protein
VIREAEAEERERGETDWDMLEMIRYFFLETSKRWFKIDAHSKNAYFRKAILHG